MVLLLSLFACDPVETVVPPTEFGDCDPIAFRKCAFPFPSSFYEREDDFSPTGVRVRLGETTIPYTNQDSISYQPEPTYWNELDGFSPLSPLLYEFPDQAEAGLVDYDDIGASLLDTSNIAILDWETGERMPHWAELDYSGGAMEGARVLQIRPAVPLHYGRRYVVAIRGMTNVSGSVIEASEGFAALRDGTATENWDIEGRRDLYDDIFAKVEANGWSRTEVQVAWDFHVKSVENVAGRQEWIRDDAKTRVGADGPDYVIDSTRTVEYTVEENASTWKRIYGTMTVPLYTELDDVDTLLTRDADGMPYYNGDTTVPFTIIVPRTAQTDPRPLKLLQYGHGLLGSQDEVESGYLGELADRYGYILFAVDWTGMKEDDSDAIALMILNDLGRFAMIPEREQQGYVEFAAAVWMMQGAMSRDPALMIDGTALVDPSEVYYYGNSQGAILGGGYLAFSKEIERATLGVGGMPYATLLTRSSDFTPFFSIFQSVYDDQRDIALWMALLQSVWDLGEAGGVGRLINETPLDGVPAKAILLQDAVGDAQVTTIAAHNMARAYGAKTIEPELRPAWNVEQVAGPYAGSVLAEYDHGAPPIPTDNTPPNDDFDTHEDTRRAWAAQEQMATFFATGMVENFCDGQCLCAEGNCDDPAAVE